MRELGVLLSYDMKRRYKDGFLIGYNIIFPILLTLLLGYLLAGSYGKEFTSYHYYSLVILPFCIAMAMITAAYVGKEEAYKKTAMRFLYAPIFKTQIVLSKLLSCTVIISVCNIIVLLFVKLVFQLPIYGEFWAIIFLLTAEAYCFCAIGMFIGLGMKNFIVIKNIINLPLCAAAILGGAFYPIGTMNDKLELLLKLSPLTWINQSMFRYLYDGDRDYLYKISLILILIGTGFTLLAIVRFRKEEFIHGDLPGYEK
ncbi:ABC transporter permease [Mobilitalea sibirica]|uniref:Transport permease protein n=1 Tax=Mobilitalea sibirica TaxID=1462919 RepID=A0A8J7KV76_9FIRM|nr:ABC transporter permease [Mobilitalea sibirica]MBH1939835.1 ABC transporter permease [Mobilitalea sibirica]